MPGNNIVGLMKLYKKKKKMKKRSCLGVRKIFLKFVELKFEFSNPTYISTTQTNNVMPELRNIELANGYYYIRILRRIFA